MYGSSLLANLALPRCNSQATKGTLVPCLVPPLLTARRLHCPPCPPCPPKAASRSQTAKAAQALIRAAAPRSLHLWEDPAFWALPAALPSFGEIAKDLLEDKIAVLATASWSTRHGCEF